MGAGDSRTLCAGCPALARCPVLSEVRDNFAAGGDLGSERTSLERGLEKKEKGLEKKEKGRLPTRKALRYGFSFEAGTDAAKLDESATDGDSSSMKMKCPKPSWSEEECVSSSGAPAHRFRRRRSGFEEPVSEKDDLMRIWARADTEPGYGDCRSRTVALRCSPQAGVVSPGFPACW